MESAKKNNIYTKNSNIVPLTKNAATKPTKSTISFQPSRNQIGISNHVYGGGGVPSSLSSKNDEVIAKSKIAVEALRIRGADFCETLEEMVEILPDEGSLDYNKDLVRQRCSMSNSSDVRPCVSIPEDVLEALEEYMNDSDEQTLVYKAIQPLVGMVFGKHGSFATHLHGFGASLELTEDRFRIKCPRAKARQVQEEFEKKLASVLVRLNMENVTVVMRPEKIMVMLTPWCLTPVLVIGMLTPQLVVLRIYDPREERRFEAVNSDMQRFYRNLHTQNQLKDIRLSLPITCGTLACYYDPNIKLYMRVVVEAMFEMSTSELLSAAGGTVSANPNGGGAAGIHLSSTSTNSSEEVPGTQTSDKVVLARIWKMDFGAYTLVPVTDLYRLQACYMQVRRQCLVAKLLYARKRVDSLLSLHEIFQQYLSNRAFYALSVGERPLNLSHVILFRHEPSDKLLVASTANVKLESTKAGQPSFKHANADFFSELKDIIEVLTEDKIYETQAYPMENFVSKLYSIPKFQSKVDYRSLFVPIGEFNSTRSSPRVAPMRLSNDGQSQSTRAEGVLSELLCPYLKHPEKRFIPKQNGLVLSSTERNLAACSAPTQIYPTSSGSGPTLNSFQTAKLTHQQPKSSHNAAANPGVDLGLNQMTTAAFTQQEEISAAAYQHFVNQQLAVFSNIVAAAAGSNGCQPPYSLVGLSAAPSTAAALHNHNTSTTNNINNQNAPMLDCAANIWGGLGAASTQWFYPGLPLINQSTAGQIYDPGYLYPGQMTMIGGGATTNQMAGFPQRPLQLLTAGCSPQLIYK